MKLLFVCTGNTCRSVLAQQWLGRRLKELGLEWEVRSAGVAADPFYPVPEEVREALAESGADRDFQHKPTRMDRGLADWADLILVMQEIHKAVIDREFPGAAKKTHLLKAFAGMVGQPAEVPDPIGSGIEQYRKCLGVIKEAIEALIRKQTAKR